MNNMKAKCFELFLCPVFLRVTARLSIPEFVVQPGNVTVKELGTLELVCTIKGILIINHSCKVHFQQQSTLLCALYTHTHTHTFTLTRTHT